MAIRSPLAALVLVLFSVTVASAASAADPPGLRSGSSEFYVPQPGLLMDGEVRSDTSVNFGSLFKGTFTIITYYETPPRTKLLELMQKNWEALGNSGDRIAHVTKVLFPHAQNHWDSLVPLA